jgi:flavin-dependent dehydrogenase
LKINKIVIVGGGSAGWMTASILIKSFPKKEIILIESPSIPKIGVGESTYEGINYYLEYLEINREDFFKKTDATIKLAIKFKDFYKKNYKKEFIYPFGQPVLENTKWGLEDWLVKKYCYPDTPEEEYVESYFPSALLVKNNTLSDNFENFHLVNSTALHFDAIKFANWLKENYAIPKGVKNILSEVVHINVDKNGIKNLILLNNEEINADLYIDCTGFKALLIDKTLKEKFVSYEELLPNNSAWATRINYSDPKIELENITTCTAIENGWCWNIPLWSRFGSGYVYSDKFVDDQTALKEFKNYLKTKKTIKEIESLEFKNIKMRVGIHENVWSKNVVAIGLAAGFIEPLESNGLFTVHEFLFELIRALLREETSQWEKDIFNSAVKEKFNLFVDFIKLHYVLSLRNDTEYWQHIFNKKNNLYENENTLIDSLHLINTKNIKTKIHILPISGGINWISAGMNYFLLDKVSFRLGEIQNQMNYKNDLNNYFLLLDQKRKKWDNWAKNNKSSFSFLNEKYYN